MQVLQLSLLILLSFSLKVNAKDHKEFKIISETGLELKTKVTKDMIYLLEYRQGHTASIAFTDAKLPKGCIFQGKQCRSANLPLIFNGSLKPLKRNIDFKISFISNGRRKSYGISLLPPNILELDFSGKSVIKKPIIFSVAKLENTSCDLFVLNPDGSIYFYRKLDHLCYDFRVHEVSNKLFYSYLEATASNDATGAAGTRMVLDKNFSSYEEIKTIVDMHEFHYLGPKHWMAFISRLGRLGSGTSYLDKRIVEMKNGVEIFNWGVSDIMKQSGTEATALAVLFTLNDNEVISNVMHLNSIQLIGDEFLLIGLGANGVAYVNKKSKKIIWILGGASGHFKLLSNQHMALTHTPTYDPTTNSLLLFSNSGVSSFEFKNPTRIVNYKLDTISRKIKEYEVIYTAKYISHAAGSVQKSGEVYSIGLGIQNERDNDFVEVQTEKKTASFKMREKGLYIYRIYRQPFGQISE